jgi:hypothetical protein
MKDPEGGDAWRGQASSVAHPRAQLPCSRDKSEEKIGGWRTRSMRIRERLLPSPGVSAQDQHRTLLLHYAGAGCALCGGSAGPNEDQGAAA